MQRSGSHYARPKFWPTIRNALPGLADSTPPNPLSWPCQRYPDMPFELRQSATAGDSRKRGSPRSRRCCGKSASARAFWSCLPLPAALPL